MTHNELARTVALAVLLVVVLLRPALTDLEGNFPGMDDSEQVCGAWLQHSAHEAMWEHHEFPIVYRNVAHAEGGRLYPLFLLNVLLTLPLYPLLDTAGVHSLSLALNVALAFVFSVMLLRNLSGSWWASLPGAVLFSVSPYMVSHLIYGPVESTTYAWILPAVLAAERLAAGKRMRPGLTALTGLLVAVCFYNSIYSGMFAAGVVLFSLSTRGLTRRSLGRHGLQAGLALLLAAALVVPMGLAIRHTMDHPLSLTPDRAERVDTEWNDTLLDDWTVQDVATLVWPSQRFYGGKRYPVIYLGLVALAATIVAVVRVREARRWGWLGLGGAIFCLGGTLRVMGTTPELFGEPVRLPAGIICRLPLLEGAISHPFRFLPVVLMAMGAALALGLAHGEGESRGPRRWQSLLLSALIAVDLGMMYPEGPFRLPVVEMHSTGFYDQIRDDPEDYVILDVPVGRTTGIICGYYLDQEEHQKRVPYTLFGPVLDHESPAGAFTDGLVLPNEMEFEMRLSGQFGCHLTDCAGVEDLAAMDYRYLVLHRLGAPAIDDPLQECVELCLPDPVHVDELVRVYEFPPAPADRDTLRRMTAPPTSMDAPRP